MLIEEIDNFTGNIYTALTEYIKSLNLDPENTYADNMILLSNTYWHDTKGLFKRIIQKKAYLFTIERVDVDYDISKYEHLIESDDPESIRLGISLVNEILYPKLQNLYVLYSGMKAHKLLTQYSNPNLSPSLTKYQYQLFLKHEMKFFKKHKINY